MKGMKIAFAFLLLSGSAFAQPVEDPGLAPPAAQPAPPPAPPPKAAPAAPTLEPHQYMPTVSPPAPEVHETVETKMTPIELPPEPSQLYERTVPTTTFGPIGLIRAMTGEESHRNTFRIGLHLGGFQQDNLIISSAGGQKGDTNGHFNGDLTINYTPIKYLELYIALFNTSNQNTRTDAGRTDPSVIMALGDLQFGVKGRYNVTKFMDLALHVGVKLINSVSGILWNGDSTNVAIDAIASWDLRHAAATSKIPLRFHVNFGFLRDNSFALLNSSANPCTASTSNDPCIRSRAVEVFAYGIGTNRLRMALAVDAPVLAKSVGIQPMLEYHLEASVGDGDPILKKALASVVPSDRLNSTVAQYLTIGLRIRPMTGLVLDAAVDVGLQSPGFAYGPPVPAWNVMAGAQYVYDRGKAAKATMLTKTITREINKTAIAGRIRGVIRDANTKKEIGGAVVKYVGKTQSPQLTDEHGRFVSYDFPPGQLKLEVSREDYEAVVQPATAFANGETPVEVLLVPKPPAAGHVRGRITGPEGLPVVATVRLASTAGAIIDADIEGPGVFNAKLPHGEYTLDVVADGFLAKSRLVSVTPGQVQSMDISLAKKPAQPHVTVGTGELVLKGTIHFGTTNAEIRPDSSQLLDEIADVLVRNPQIKKVRIEGHTDNRGDPLQNRMLSASRANSVMAYLVKAGLDPARMDAQGLGADQPLMPNLTPAGRAKNRRVAFKIVE
jgi:outer membrane protein OmpA-like peptidoglycan-associated protein